MATRTLPDPVDRLDRPVVVEVGVVVGLIALTYGLGRLTSGLVTGSLADLPLESDVALLALGTLVYPAFVAVFAAAYVHVRDIDVGLALPTRDHLEIVGLALAGPAALVGLTKATGVLTGVTLNELATTSYGTVPSPGLLVLLAVVAPVLGGVAFAVLCQVLIQQTFAGVVEGDVAALLTALVAGFLLNDAGGLTTRPDLGHLLGAGLFVAALGLAVLASERVDRDWLRTLASLPALAILSLAVLSGVAGIDTLAGGLFVATHFLVLGIAALGYERTDSLLVPALAYASLLVTIEVVLLTFEVGLQSW